MSKTTDYVIETMNAQIEAEVLKLWQMPWFPGQGSKIKKLEEKYNLIQSHGGGIINKINKCLNCHDMVLYPDEQCPDCGRQA